MRPLVLVEEKDVSTRRLLEIFLHRANLEVDSVSSELDALLLLERVDYQAILLDLLIQGRGGSEVLSRIAELRPALLDRIVVVSSASEPLLQEVRDRFAGVQVLRKPFDLADLMATVQRSIARGECSQRADSSAGQAFIRGSVASAAKAGAVVRLGSDELLHLSTSFGYEKETAARFFPLPTTAPFPFCAAVRQRRGVWLSSVSVASVEYPLLIPIWQKNASNALAAVPLLDGDRVVGAVGWSFRDRRTFREEERDRLTALANACRPLLESSPDEAIA